MISTGRLIHIARIFYTLATDFPDGADLAFSIRGIREIRSQKSHDVGIKAKGD